MATQNFWQAIVSRDANFDGKFFYGVSSTGIFCRPSCKSRQPKFENTVFFDSPLEAVKQGFRACLRCQPLAENLQNPNVELVEKICQMLAETSEETLNLSTLAAQFNLSATHLQKVFRKVLGITPHEYRQNLRLENFKRQIKDGNSLTYATYEAGYGSSSRVYEKSDANFGMTPNTYRKGGKGMKINFAVADCALGKILVAKTERGICAVTLGDDEISLTENLHREFPNAVILPDEATLNTEITLLLQHLQGNQSNIDLPLDVRATAFQIRVWQELRKIPAGETRSYKQVAENLGNPNAFRAVARACAANPVALVNPCHRVVAADGNLSGYRWGIERKQALLEKEKVIGKQ